MNNYMESIKDEEYELMNRRMTIACRISDLMKKRNISRSELSEKIGITQAAISYLLTGKRFPSFSTIVKLEGFFGERIIQVIGYDN